MWAGHLLGSRRDYIIRFAADPPLLAAARTNEFDVELSFFFCRASNSAIAFSRVDEGLPEGRVCRCASSRVRKSPADAFLLGLARERSRTWLPEARGKTLRENLGLPRPANRFFSNGWPNQRK